jgi:hypothetical protein
MTHSIECFWCLDLIHLAAILNWLENKRGTFDQIIRDDRLTFYKTMLAVQILVHDPVHQQFEQLGNLATW